MHAPLIFLIAGEPSGDALGANLMASLKKETKGRARFAGIGGPKMAAEGLESLFPMEELSVMGLFEILPKIPRLRFLINETVSQIATLRPDALVTIDSPGFTLRVAKKVAGLGFPLVHYVAPSVWAWKPGRAKKIARYLNHVLALLPFEPSYMLRAGLSCTFVGHPVLESGADKGDGPAF
ncbi:MAG: lipid-A-disaccharide synthase, partial [Rhodospirillales bacterium]|nr:lipid-A-disaccharide synthase [Rhodospirillales bacterium]